MGMQEQVPLRDKEGKGDTEGPGSMHPGGAHAEK